MKLTKHGKRRIKQRANIGKSDKKVKNVAKKALERGYRHNETKGSLNKYITSLYFKNQEANNIRIYNNFVWIFVHTKLITVFPLPTKFKENFNNYIKET